MAIQHKNAYVALAVGIALIALTLFLLMLGYGRLKSAQNSRKNARDPEKLQVLVAVEPMADLVERVGGDAVEVAALAPAGKSPETFAPSPALLASVAATQAFFYTGAPVEERFLENVKTIAPDSKLVDLREGVELIPDPHRHDADDHDHDHDADHDDAESMDPHLWTSPAIVREMVAKIAEALAELKPEKAELFSENARKLDEELAALQQETKDALAPYEGEFFIVYHPAYGYFAREFGLVQRAIETDGKAPRPRELEALVDDAKAENVRAIVVQPEFNRASAQVVANAIGAKIVDHSPLQRDYFENIRSLTAAILEGFAPAPANDNNAAAL